MVKKKNDSRGVQESLIIHKITKKTLFFFIPLKWGQFILPLLIIIPCISFSYDQINISSNNNIINTVDSQYNSGILFPGYNHNIFDLFKIDFSTEVNLIKQESKIIINSEDTNNDSKLTLNSKPEILDYLIEKIGKDKIKKYIDNGLLHIIGDNNKTGSYSHKYSSSYYLSDENIGFKGDFFDIKRKYKVQIENNKNIKIQLFPFDKNIFLGYRIGAEPPYPVFSIFDNSILPQELKLIINNKEYSSTTKYSLQGYNINTYYSQDNGLDSTMKSYVLIPSYEFNIELPKGESVIEIDYKKFFGSNEEIIIQESY